MRTTDGTVRISTYGHALALAGLGIVALWNNCTHAEGQGNATIEEVVITGSRIATTELQSPVPITVLSEQMIESNGTQNVSDLLRELPSVGTSGLSSTNSNFLTTNVGINTINLRNLGDARTLVLVNGRRMTPGESGTSVVDFNTIPTDFIDHIEITTGGASAIYGSDAVAGVVNVIYKKDFSGVMTHFQGGATSKGDDAQYLGSLTIGQSFVDGRGRVMVNLSYDKDEGLYSRDRARSAVDQQIQPDGTLAVGTYSSFAPQGRFSYSAPSQAQASQGLFTFNPDNTLHDGFSNAQFGFNRNAFRRISVPVNRTLLASALSFDLNAHHELYSEITYALTRAQSQIEPFPLASAEGANSLYDGAVNPTTGDTIGMPISNAYFQTLPSLAPVRANIDAWNAANPTDQIQYLQFRKRLSDIADRSNQDKRQTMRTVIGVKGDLPISGWSYDASYVYGRTTDAQATSGQVNYANMRAALDSVVDPATGQIVCADAVAVAEGCVPVNPFGYHSITPAAAAWIQAPVTRDVTIQEQVISGYIQGPVLQLPAGPVSLVLGVENRKDNSEELFDALSNLGLNGFNVSPNVVGSFNVSEAFAEAQVPVLKELPLADKLQIDAAFRQAHYSTSGSVHAWKIGLEWAPVRDVRFRGVYSEAIRAPNIGELFGGEAQTFPNVHDPCDGVTASSTSQYAAACRAIPGVAAAIAANGVFQYSLFDQQAIAGFNGSNPNLQPERAKTATLGLVFQPRWLNGFSATVDYYDIRVEGAISAVDRADSINQCLLSGNSVFCNNVIRSSASGKITTVNALLTNVGGIKTAGIETAIRYLWDLNSTPVGGKLNLSLSENHLRQLEQVNFPGAPPTDNLGELFDGSSATRLGAGFEDRAILAADYMRGPWEFSWTATYFSSIQDTLAAYGIVSTIYNHVPAYVYHDAQIRYKWGDKRGVDFYAGARNVFNKQPPVLPSGMASEITGTETAADTYDVLGRFLYAGFTAKF
jgi:iron complex outermembrane receptor protein